jgi:hypothetical protein
VSLFLDSNGFDKIEGLECCVKLRCLYLQKNLISRIEGLGECRELVTLDLSENRIRVLENLRGLGKLGTLNVAKNFLEEYDSVVELKDCRSITNLDISNNELKDVSIINDVLGSMPELVATNTSGNPMVREIPNFRKTAIWKIKKLRYMDRPVFENERLSAVAYFEGGYELEKKVKSEYQEKKREEERKHLQDFRDWRAALKEKKLKELENPTDESIAEKEKYEQFFATHAVQAQKDGDAERELYSKIGAVQEMGKQEMGYREERDVFGNVRKVKITEEEMEEVELRKQKMIKDGIVVDENDVTRGTSSDLFSFQGGGAGEGVKAVMPGEKTASVVEQTVEVVEEEKSSINNVTEDEEDDDVPEIEEVTNNIDGNDSDEERQQRVDESMHIWRMQQEAKKNPPPPLTSSSVTVPANAVDGGTWSDRQAADAVENVTKDFTQLLMDAKNSAEAERHDIGLSRSREEQQQQQSVDPTAFYWSEKMDAQLAQLVHACEFDFDDVAAKLKDEAVDVELEKITEEACRKRWCELDLDDGEGDVPIASDGQRLPHPVKIQLGEGGKQLSFAELQRSVNSQQSGLLKVPTVLPGVGDSDSDGDGDEVVSAEAMRSRMKAKMTNFETLD